MTRRVLLTVSGTIPADLDAAVEAGRRPRADYLEMARRFDADLLDYAAARQGAGRWARLLERLAGPNALLAWTCFRQRAAYQAVFTDGEPIGMPYAVLTRFTKRRPRHLMIGHRLSAPKKMWLHRTLRLQRRIDVVVVYAATQRDVALRLGYRPEQVALSTFMVDTEFWRADHVRRAARDRPLICAVGQELRDYPTMIEAVRGLEADVVVAAASPWSKRADTSADIEVPANVTVGGYDLYELRQLYADSDLVVVPLQETDFQAGITTILEAMSMARAIICSKTTGQQDTIREGVTGRYVPVGEVKPLRATIEDLLGDPAQARRLGAAARAWVTEHADIVGYADGLAALTRGT